MMWRTWWIHTMTVVRACPGHRAAPLRGVRAPRRLGNGRRDRRAVRGSLLAVADRAYVLVNGRVDTEGREEELRDNLREIEGKYLGVD
jgi:hypothetical protein